MIGDFSYWLNQQAYRAPHVFNFYLPNHIPQGELQQYDAKGRIPNRSVYAPESEIFTAVAANRIANRFRAEVGDAELDLTGRDVTGSFPFQIQLDFSDEIALAADSAALLEHLDLFMCNGTLADDKRDTLSLIVAEETTNLTDRAKGAILALLNAPDCVVAE
jgi:hypothetical protein